MVCGDWGKSASPKHNLSEIARFPTPVKRPAVQAPESTQKLQAFYKSLVITVNLYIHRLTVEEAYTRDVAVVTEID
tara:strand:+ start:519 stop:746 length:228 start_codon:yes stop_codon:yes gene_type:complete